MVSATQAGGPQEAVWYFDLVSPFSYLALPAVETFAQHHPVRFRPVLLGALLARWELRGPAEIAPKRLCTYRLVQFTADRAGLPLRFPPRHPFRSVEAMRLLAALDGAPAAVRAGFDFVKEGRAPSDPAELDALRLRLGIADTDALMADTDAKQRLRASTEAATAAGVFGVPTLALNGELFWGVDAMPMAEAFLADPGLLARGEMARLADLPFGVERKRIP